MKTSIHKDNWPTSELNGGGGGRQPSRNTGNNGPSTNSDSLLTMQLIKMLAQAKEMPAGADIPVPKAPVYAPPPSATSADIVAAGNEARRAAARRRGFRSTRIAGSTGGFGSANSKSMGSSAV